MKSCGSSFPCRCFCVLMKVVTGDHIKKDEMGGQVTRMGGTGNFYSVFTGKPEGKGHLNVRGVYGTIIL